MPYLRQKGCQTLDILFLAYSWCSVIPMCVPGQLYDALRLNSSF